MSITFVKKSYFIYIQNFPYFDQNADLRTFLIKSSFIIRSQSLALFYLTILFTFVN